MKAFLHVVLLMFVFAAFPALAVCTAEYGVKTNWKTETDVRNVRGYDDISDTAYQDISRIYNRGLSRSQDIANNRRNQGGNYFFILTQTGTCPLPAGAPANGTVTLSNLNSHGATQIWKILNNNDNDLADKVDRETGRKGQSARAFGKPE